MKHIVKVNWDDDANVWYAICSTVPFAIENESLDTLIERIKVVATETLNINNTPYCNSSLVIQAEYIQSIT